MKKTDLKLKNYVSIENRMNATLEIADIVLPNGGEYKPHFRTIAEFLVFCKHFVDGLELESEDNIMVLYDEDEELRNLYEKMGILTYECGDVKSAWFSVTSDANDLICHRLDMIKKVDLESKYERLIDKQIEYETARIDLVTESVREKKLSNEMLEKMTPEAIASLGNMLADGSLNPQNVGVEILNNYKDNVVPFPGLEDDLK